MSSRSTIIEPGPVVTSIMENTEVQPSLPKEADEKTAAMFQASPSAILAAFKDTWQQGDDIGDVILEAITSEKPHLRYSTNRHFDGFLKQIYTDLTGDSAVNASIEFFKMQKE